MVFLQERTRLARFLTYAFASDGKSYHLRYVMQFDIFTLTSHYN